MTALSERAPRAEGERIGSVTAIDPGGSRPSGPAATRRERWHGRRHPGCSMRQCRAIASSPCIETGHGRTGDDERDPGQHPVAPGERQSQRPPGSLSSSTRRTMYRTCGSTGAPAATTTVLRGRGRRVAAYMSKNGPSPQVHADQAPCLGTSGPRVRPSAPPGGLPSSEVACMAPGPVRWQARAPGWRMLSTAWRAGRVDRGFRRPTRRTGQVARAERNTPLRRRCPPGSASRTVRPG